MTTRPSMWAALAAVSLLGCGGAGGGSGFDTHCGDWTQMSHDTAHDGNSCVGGQTPKRALSTLVYDPFAAEVAADNFGIVTHYQAPLIVDDDLYMELKTGTYVPCNPPGSGMPAGCGAASWSNEIWNEVRYAVNADGTLTQKWQHVSSWKPEPPAGFEPVFHAAVSGGFIYVPEANGAISKIDRQIGNVVATIDPFHGDAMAYVAGPIVADDKGNVYYNVIHVDAEQPWYGDDAGSALVEVINDGKDSLSIALYASMVPGAPAPTDACVVGYDSNTVPLPWPPGPGADGTVPQPLSAPCGSQRPSMNVAPAIAPDGTIYTVSRAYMNEGYSYVVALNPDLTTKWATSLRGLLHDGCGVLVPDDGDPMNHPLDCSPGAALGVDPSTNDQPAAFADDSSSASPVVLPDGKILYGALTYYNGYRGHLMELGSDGKFITSFDFGWDITPAVQHHSDGTYSIITKDNHYGVDYSQTGVYYITSLDKYLKPEWQFKSMNTQSCVRQPDGSLSCVDDHPSGFEWCINAPAIDRDGNVYGNSEDGNLYVLDAKGNLKSTFFLNEAIGAAYTPVSLDHRGRIFALNAGELTVVGE